MIELEFTKEEIITLNQLVETRIKELGPEIHHTDKRGFRKELVQLQEKLERLHERLAVAAV